MFVRNKAAVAGLIILIGVILMTYLGPLFYDQDPTRIVARPLKGPGTEDIPLLGTDYLGRDVLAGVINGGSTTLRVAAVSAVLIAFIGVTIGALAGFYGGWIDNLLMRFTEIFQVLPALLFSMVVVALFSPTPTTISVAIGIVLWPQLARLTRAEFLRLKNLEFVKAARAIGASDTHIMFQVILPNALPPLIVATTLVMGSAILFEAYLAFLGLGDPNQLSWGLDDRPQPADLLDLVVDDHLPRSRDLLDGAELQPDRRRPAGRATTRSCGVDDDRYAPPNRSTAQYP